MNEKEYIGGSDSMEAITELDLFKFLVLRDEESLEAYETTKRNVSTFLGRVTTNIFTNEYYVLYEAMQKAKKYNTVLTFQQLSAIVIENVGDLVDRDAIFPEEFAENTGDVSEVKETLFELVMTTHEELKTLPIVDNQELSLNIDLYLHSWGEEQVQQILATQSEIVSEGKRIGGKTLRGLEDGNAYYNKSYAVVQQLVFSQVDEQKNTIRTDTMTFEELRSRYKGDSLERVVARTGVEGVDSHIGEFRKGDMVSTMGQPGAGKTRWNANIMYNAMMMGNNVFWLPLEGNDLQAFSLIVARHILNKFEDRVDLDDKRIYDNSFPENLGHVVDEAMMDLLRNPAYGKIKIQNTILYDDEVMGLMERTYDEGFHFDVLCIDYVSLILSKTNEMKSAYLSRLVTTLKSNAMNFRNRGYLLLLPHQLTKEVIRDLKNGEDHSITGSADTSEIIKSSDIAFSLFRTEEQAAKDMITVFFTKTRFAAMVPPLEVLALHGKCFFADIPED